MHNRIRENFCRSILELSKLQVLAKSTERRLKLRESRIHARKLVSVCLQFAKWIYLSFRRTIAYLKIFIYIAFACSVTTFVSFLFFSLSLHSTVLYILNSSPDKYELFYSTFSFIVPLKILLRFGVRLVVFVWTDKDVVLTHTSGLKKRRREMLYDLAHRAWI